MFFFTDNKSLSYRRKRMGVPILPWRLWKGRCNWTDRNAMLGETGNRNVPGYRLKVGPPDHLLFGHSLLMAEIRSRAEKICRTNIPILLYGDVGTGKETLARWIHANSQYGSGEFVKVNCAAIPGSLLESELFGYEKDAFTEANQAKPGRIEAAHRGTLFLDEIADLDLNLQGKLLHFLQDGTFSRIGDPSERKVDARILCATNKKLEEETVTGRFRQDLYYRIHVFPLNLPPLRERREDIPSLVEFFVEYFEKQFVKKADPLSPEMMGYLQNLNWQGNIRELSNGVARYVLLGPEAVIQQNLEDRKSGVPLACGTEPIPETLKRRTNNAVKELERILVLEALRANHWNRKKTAQVLKISYRALLNKIRDTGLAARGGAVNGV
jgi:DNA-binding NtrC family response regulator